MEKETRMFGIEKLDASIREYLGEITEEQKAVLQHALDHPVSEKELFEKLGVEEEKFKKFLQSFHSEDGIRPRKNEAEILEQPVSADELNGIAAGGGSGCNGGPRYICKEQLYRDIYWDEIYGTGFPNCSSTVEDGSWCGSSDACYSMAIIYRGMNSCHKAWK